MKVSLSLNENKKYLLACSFGPDSMALFKLLKDANIYFEVAHVNYHKRKESDYEEMSLKEYCLKNNVPCYVLNASKYEHKGNFQAWARRLRYNFFKECCKEHQLDAVLVAHHQDDLIENYIIQKQRNSFVKEYGISEFTNLGELSIVRPLLKYTKKELQDFDNGNNVPYSIDASNLRNDYTRNKIRHQIIEKLGKVERINYLKEIEEANKTLRAKKEIALNLIENDNSLSVEKVIDIDEEIFALSFFELLERNNVNCSISKNQIHSFMLNMHSKKANICIPLTDEFNYVQEYGVIRIVNGIQRYKFVLQKPGKICSEYIDIDFSNGAEDRNITDNCYPLIIEPADKSETYKIGDYQVKISRLYVDWKMPAHLRLVWPVIKDLKGNIIYIPRYRKKFIDNHKSIMRIKFM